MAIFYLRLQTIPGTIDSAQVQLPGFHTPVTARRTSNRKSAIRIHCKSRRINKLRIPNRKFFAISHLSFRFRQVALATSHLSPVTAFLIDTPRLENPATRTKQSLHFDPNRDKIALFSVIIEPAGIRLLRCLLAS
jgi:hypothetical protein